METMKLKSGVCTTCVEEPSESAMAIAADLVRELAEDGVLEGDDDVGDPDGDTRCDLEYRIACAIDDGVDIAVLALLEAQKTPVVTPATLRDNIDYGHPSSHAFELAEQTLECLSDCFYFGPPDTPIIAQNYLAAMIDHGGDVPRVEADLRARLNADAVRQLNRLVPIVRALERYVAAADGVEDDRYADSSAMAELWSEVKSALGREPTPQYAVICPSHGRVELERGEYLRQLNNEEAQWVCPRMECGRNAEWDDDCKETSGEQE